jgi:hypothetical protein
MDWQQNQERPSSGWSKPLIQMLHYRQEKPVSGQEKFFCLAKIDPKPKPAFNLNKPHMPTPILLAKNVTDGGHRRLSNTVHVSMKLG